MTKLALSLSALPGTATLGIAGADGTIANAAASGVPNPAPTSLAPAAAIPAAATFQAVLAAQAQGETLPAAVAVGGPLPVTAGTVAIVANADGAQPTLARNGAATDQQPAGDPLPSTVVASHALPPHEVRAARMTAAAPRAVAAPSVQQAGDAPLPAASDDDTPAPKAGVAHAGMAAPAAGSIAIIAAPSGTTVAPPAAGPLPKSGKLLPVAGTIAANGRVVAVRTAAGDDDAADLGDDNALADPGAPDPSVQPIAAWPAVSTGAPPATGIMPVSAAISPAPLPATDAATSSPPAATRRSPVLTALPALGVSRPNAASPASVTGPIVGADRAPTLQAPAEASKLPHGSQPAADPLATDYPAASTAGVPVPPRLPGDGTAATPPPTAIVTLPLAQGAPVPVDPVTAQPTATTPAPIDTNRILPADAASLAAGADAPRRAATAVPAEVLLPLRPAAPSTASRLARQPGAGRATDPVTPADASSGTRAADPATAPIAPAPPTPAGSATGAAAAGGPQDFGALVDRLLEARATAQGAVPPQPVSTTVTHADFGTVSLTFRQDPAGLSVSMASADPGFAPAARSAAEQALPSAAPLHATADQLPGGHPGDRSAAGSAAALVEVAAGGSAQGLAPVDAAAPSGATAAGQGAGVFTGSGSPHSQSHAQPRAGAIAANRSPAASSQRSGGGKGADTGSGHGIFA